MSKKYRLGVLGDPIEHSLSPFIHSRFARNENINIEYLPYRVKEVDFDQLLKSSLEFISIFPTATNFLEFDYKDSGYTLSGIFQIKTIV